VNLDSSGFVENTTSLLSLASIRKFSDYMGCDKTLR
jgi:hypothetical protein